MKKQMRWLLYAMNFLAFFAISMVNTQMIPFLSKLGYTVVQRGYILAANAVVAIAGQFLFGYLCDRFQRVKVFFFAAYVLLDETWMLEIDQENYGRLRASGALGLTIGSPIAGYLVRHFHYKSLLISLGIVSVILCWLIYKAKDAEKKEGERIRMESVRQLLKNKGYLLLVLIYLLVYMIGTADQYVVIDKMLDIGGDTTAVGIKWALQSFMEVPLFLFSSKILERFQTKTLLYFGTFMYGVKFLLYGFSFQPWMIILTAALQLVTLPIIMLTSKVLVKEITPQKLFSSAQMFAMAVFIGVSGLITPLITSYLDPVYRSCFLHRAAAADFLLCSLLSKENSEEKLLIYICRGRKADCFTENLQIPSILCAVGQ